MRADHVAGQGLRPEPSNQVFAVDDGVCTQTAPVVPSSPTLWQMLDDIDGDTVYHTRFNVLQSCPVHLKGRFRQATRTALEARHQAALAEDATQEIRVWKLFCVLPFWLLRRPHGGGRVGKVELSKRFDDFAAGSWTQLHRNAELDTPSPSRKHTTMTIEEKGRAVEQRVRMGEVSRARQCLTGAAVAPGNDTTFQDMLNFQPDVPVHLDRKTFLSSLKSAPRGSSPGPGGWTYEHLKGMLDDTDTFEWLLSACDSLSQARVPSQGSDGRENDSSDETRRGCQGHPNRGFSEASCGKNTREAVQQSVRDRVCALPVRFVHQGGDGLRRAHVACSNGRKTNCDHLERGWDWSLRSCPQVCDVGSTLAHARSQGTPPVREVVLRSTFSVFVVRRRWSAAHSDPSRGRRAR